MNVQDVDDRKLCTSHIKIYYTPLLVILELAFLLSLLYKSGHIEHLPVHGIQFILNCVGKTTEGIILLLDNTCPMWPIAFRTNGMSCCWKWSNILFIQP